MIFFSFYFKIPYCLKIMIRITRLNGTTLWINPHLIEFAEETPDTVITFISDKKIVIKEKIDVLNKKIVDYRKQLGFSIQEP